MPNVKISELPAASTPLAGTELVPLVQSGATKKVSVADLTVGRSVSASALTASSGNLTFSGTAQRIQGDFSNATRSDRLAFQSSTVNSETRVGILPNGTGTVSGLNVHNNSDANNASLGQLLINATELRFANAVIGTGSYVPMTFFNGGSEAMRITTARNVVQGTAAVATTATDGFLWITSCAGAPTGTPTAPYTNAAAMVVDTANNRLYVRVGSTWRYATLT